MRLPVVEASPRGRRGRSRFRPGVGATAPQRAGEPAWHRRARRRRGDARALLRVAAASRLLASHHSCQPGGGPRAAMPNGAARGKGAGVAGGGGGKGGGCGGKGSTSAGGGGGQDSGRWSCRLCNLPDNFAWRARCRRCEAYRVQGEGGPLATSPNPFGQTLAERQLQQQRQSQRQQRAAGATERRLQAEVERLQSLLAARPAAARGDKPAADAEADDDEDALHEPMDTAEAYATWTEDERRQQIDAARASLPYLVGKHGETSCQATGVREEIAALEKASRDAKPFKTHRAMLERRRDRLRARIKKDDEELAKAEREHEELAERIKGIRADTADRNKELAGVEEELADLVKKALAEGDAAGEAGKPEDDSAAPWSAQSASTLLRTLAARPGIPPEFAQLLLHVHQAAEALAAAAAVAKPPAAASTASTGGRPPPASPAAAAGGAAASPPAGAGAGENQGHHQQQRGSKTDTPTLAGAAAGSAAGSAAATTPTAAAAAAAAKPSGGGAGAAPAATAATARAEDEDELVEDGLGDAMECDVEETLGKLSSGDQAKIRAAIRWGGRRGRGGGDGDGGGGAGREREDRERSPRPTKQSEAEL